MFAMRIFHCQHGWSNGFNRRRTPLFILGILLLAFVLRVWGVTWGLPYVLHADEPRYVNAAMQMFKTCDLNPRSYPYLSINSFVYVINAAALAPYYAVGWLSGAYHSRSDISPPRMLTMGTGFTTDPGTFLLGRMVTVLFGTAAVFLLFLAGRELPTGTAVGLVAALLLAVSPSNVLHSKYITPDEFLVFFFALAVWCSLRILHREPTWGVYVLAGLAIGFAVSTKISAGLVVVPVAMGHFLRLGWRGFSNPRIYVAAAMSLAALVATTPFLLIDPIKVYQDWRRETMHYSTGHAGMEGDTLKFYLSYLLFSEGPWCVLAVFGAVRGFMVRSRPLILLSFSGLLYFAFVSSFPVRNERTILPLLPFLALLAAAFLSAAWEWSRRFGATVRWRAVRAALFSAAVVFVSIGFGKSALSDYHMVCPDACDLAREWIAQRLSPITPKGTKVVLEAYSPYIDPQHFIPVVVTGLTQHTAEWYRQNSCRFFIVTRKMYGRFQNEPKRYGKELAEYDNMFAKLKLVKVFNENNNEIRIYMLE